MCVFQSAVVEHVVEYHRDAECANLDGLGGFIFQLKPEYEFPRFQCPAAREPQRKIRR